MANKGIAEKNLKFKILNSEFKISPMAVQEQSHIHTPIGFQE